MQPASARGDATQLVTDDFPRDQQSADLHAGTGPEPDEYPLMPSRHFLRQLSILGFTLRERSPEPDERA